MNYTTEPPQLAFDFDQPRSKYCKNSNCERAGQLLPISDFNKRTKSSDGYAPFCRKCANDKLREMRKNDPEGKEKANAHMRQFRKTEKGRIGDRKGKSKYRKTAKGRANDAERRQRDKHKLAARSAVNGAIKYGHIPEPENLACYQCGKQAKEYHHYLGYEPEHRLDVKPVCKLCHASIHHSPNDSH